MSSNAFQALKARQDRVSNSSPYTLVVQITGYDTNQAPHYAIGHPLMDNGEPDETRTVRVFLRADKDAGKREYARTEIADFANPRHKAATTEGGIIMFASAVATDTQGEYSARWADAVSHYAGEAACRTGYATVFYRTGERPFFSLEYYKPEGTLRVDGIKAIEQTLPAALEPSSGSTGMAALIRLVSNEGETVAVRAVSAWNKDEGSGFTMVATGLQSAAKFYEKEDWALIKQVFEAGEVAMAEIIPGMRINAVGATLKSLLKKPQRLEAMNNVYRDEDGHAIFTKTWFAARFHESGDPYLTALVRAASDSPRYRAANIPTANFEPSLEQTLMARLDAEDAMAPRAGTEGGAGATPHRETPPRHSPPASAPSAPAVPEQPTQARPSRAPNLKPPAQSAARTPSAPAATPTPAAPPVDEPTSIVPQMPPGMDDDALELGEEDIKSLEAFSMQI